MERDQNGKIQSNLDLRALQQRSGIHGAPYCPLKSTGASRERRPTLTRLQEMLREIIGAVPDAAIPPADRLEQKAPAAAETASPPVIYVDSSGEAKRP